MFASLGVAFIMIFETDFLFVDALRNMPLASAMLDLVFLTLYHNPDVAVLIVAGLSRDFTSHVHASWATKVWPILQDTSCSNGEIVRRRALHLIDLLDLKHLSI